MTLLLIAAFALVAPTAAWRAAHDAYRDGVRTERVEQTTMTQTKAVLLADAAVPPPSRKPRPTPVRVQARWTAPDGTQITGPLSVSGGARKGTLISIWVDRTGRPVDPPRQRPETISNAATRAGLVLGVFALSLLALRALLRRVLDQRRLTGWQTAWLRVEPLWSGRRRPGPRQNGPAA